MTILGSSISQTINLDCSSDRAIGGQIAKHLGVTVEELDLIDGQSDFQVTLDYVIEEYPDRFVEHNVKLTYFKNDQFIGRQRVPLFFIDNGDKKLGGGDLIMETRHFWLPDMLIQRTYLSPLIGGEELGNPVRPITEDMNPLLEGLRKMVTTQKIETFKDLERYLENSSTDIQCRIGWDYGDKPICGFNT